MESESNMNFLLYSKSQDEIKAIQYKKIKRIVLYAYEKSNLSLNLSILNSQSTL